MHYPTGYIPEPIKIGEDYVLGSYSKLPRDIVREDGQWLGLLSPDELQIKNGVETYSCISQTLDNQVEMYARGRFGISLDKSPRFLASVSGTKEGGNTPSRVFEVPRKIGIAKERDWPFADEIASFAEYIELPPPKLYALARTFLDEWDYGHEFVPGAHEAVRDGLRLSALGISVPAWFEKDGRYYAPDGVPHNHMTTLIGYRRCDAWLVRDTYPPFEKELVWDFPFQVVKRVHMRKRALPLSWWERFIRSLPFNV